MPHNRLSQVIRCFAATLGENVQADAELLERFIRERDESAFESILRNHGKMVLGVCRRVLGNEQDAEDAFLVLARRARSLREPGRLGNWLFGIAYRTACSAKRASVSRQKREAAVAWHIEADATDAGAELREVLDHEIAKLPAKYREIIVLCDLEGLPGKKVAEQLGCPEGPLKSRLARARAMLAKRLTRHGLAAGLASLVAEQAGTASLPVSLIQSTARAAVSYVAGKIGLAGVVTAEVATLTEGVLKTMFILKLKAVLAGVLVVASLTAGTGWIYYHQVGAAQPQANAAEPQKPRPAEQTVKQELAVIQETLTKTTTELELVRRELADLRKEIAQADRRPGPAGGEQEPRETFYQGKPTSYWIKMFEDRDPAYRIKAIVVLGEIAAVDKSMMPLLIDALKDERVVVEPNGNASSVAGASANAVAGLGAEAIPYLRDALKSKNSSIRKYAAAAASQLRAKELIPQLIDLLKNKKELSEIRWNAAEALRNIGPDAKAALVEVAKTGDQEARNLAEGAIQTISRENPAPEVIPKAPPPK